MPKSALRASNCNQQWDQVGQVHINVCINKIHKQGENLGPSNSIAILSLASVHSLFTLPLLRRGCAPGAAGIELIFTRSWLG